MTLRLDTASAYKKLSKWVKKEHLILTCTIDEDFAFVREIITKEVLPRGYIPVREVKDGVVTYRFAMRHFDKVFLAFPYSDKSESVQEILDKQVEKWLNMKPPKLNLRRFKGTPYPWQAIAIALADRVIGEQCVFYENDELGLGKTLVAIGWMCINWKPGDDCLVVCPNNAKWVWEREVAKWAPHLSVGIVDGTAAQRRAIIDGDYDILVINFEALRLHPELADRLFRRAICDEFHRVKNPAAEMTKRFMELRAIDWMMMSGTPILNRIEEIWVALHKGFPTIFPSMYNFKQRFCIEKGGRVIAYKNLGELRQFIEAVSIRRRFDQVYKGGPEVAPPVIRPIHLTGEQRKLYDQIFEEAKIALENGELEDVPSLFAQVIRAKQACFSPELYGGKKKSAKIEQLLEDVEILVDSGEKVLIGTQWAKSARIIERELGKHWGYAYVDGSVKGKDRMAQVDKFNNDPQCKLYIGTIKANQESISLGEATAVILTDEEWSPMVNKQFIGRSAAGGLRGRGKKRVQIFKYVAMDTVEEDIQAMLENKERMASGIVERDGSTVKARSVLSDLRSLFVRKRR